MKFLNIVGDTNINDFTVSIDGVSLTWLGAWSFSSVNLFFSMNSISVLPSEFGICDPIFSCRMFISPVIIVFLFLFIIFPMSSLLGLPVGM